METITAFSRRAHCVSARARCLVEKATVQFLAAWDFLLDLLSCALRLLTGTACLERRQAAEVRPDERKSAHAGLVDRNAFRPPSARCWSRNRPKAISSRTISSHNRSRVREMIDATGATLLCTIDFDPIEMTFSKQNALP
jgi:hypothetical protein